MIFLVHIHYLSHVCCRPPTVTEYTLDMLVSQINKLRDSDHRDGLTFIEPTEFKHHSQQELEFLLHHYSEQYPQITRLYDIGSSVQGQTLWVIEISDNPGIHEPGILSRIRFLHINT